ncbi:dihydroneopterin aldolase [Lachnospiraceae bacterium C7]|nr:dihydroneopterin aldolase [Lachnospiraceae bacterium C7]
MDNISINNLKIFATTGRFFYVNAKLYEDGKKVAIDDGTDNATNYNQVCDLIISEFSKTDFEFLETIADRICKEILVRFPLIQKVEVEVADDDTSKDLSYDTISVQVERKVSTVYVYCQADFDENKSENKGLFLDTVDEIAKHDLIRNVTRSSINEVEYDGIVLNAAIRFDTILEPEDLYFYLKYIEDNAEHNKKFDMNLEIIFFGNEVYDSDEIVIPYVGVEDKLYILKPLYEINPNFHHPISRVTIGELYEEKLERVKRKFLKEAENKKREQTNNSTKITNNVNLPESETSDDSIESIQEDAQENVQEKAYEGVQEVSQKEAISKPRVEVEFEFDTDLLEESEDLEDDSTEIATDLDKDSESDNVQEDEVEWSYLEPDLEFESDLDRASFSDTEVEADSDADLDSELNTESTIYSDKASDLDKASESYTGITSESAQYSEVDVDFDMDNYQDEEDYQDEDDKLVETDNEYFVDEKFDVEPGAADYFSFEPVTTGVKKAVKKIDNTEKVENESFDKELEIEVERKLPQKNKLENKILEAKNILFASKNLKANETIQRMEKASKDSSKLVLFDLDGTLIDSSEGITKSARYALNHFGIWDTKLDDLRFFIGPPLRNTFMEHYGFSEEKTKKAISIFRERYTKVGMFECKLYSNVGKCLRELKRKGYKIALASSKPESSCRQILEYFNIFNYFDEVVGASADGRINTKSEVLDEVFRRFSDIPTENMCLIGDTNYDVTGAAEKDIPCIVVSYGFGDINEMKKNKIAAICNDTIDIPEVLRKVWN